MGISVDFLRTIYEHLYFREANGVGFFNDEQKRLKLVNAAHQIPNVTVGHFLVYKATELFLANQVGISIEQLREFYGHLYTQERNGIKIFTEQELKYRREARVKTQVPWNSITVIQTIDNSSKTIEIKQDTLQKKAIFVKSFNPKRIVSCPHCKVSMRNDRLEKHINEKCKAGIKGG